MATDARDVMTIEQAAEYLQVTEDQVRRLIDERGLPALELVDGELRVPRGLLNDWIEREASGSAAWRSGSRVLTDEEIRRSREETYARLARGDAPRLTQEFLDRLREIRERVLAERGGEPFPKGWVREEIDEGRL